MKKPMKRGELAKSASCNIETIRYYEKIGLLPPPDRTASGHRIYADDDRKRLGFILRSRELGFSISELRTLLDLVDSDNYTCGEILSLTTGHIEEIQRRISDLKRLEHSLMDMSRMCEGGEVPDCPIVDALFMSDL